jgi:4-azaleucine resistance transporter AzlC
MKENIKENIEENLIKKAFVKSLPIMCSYLFVSMAYGIMMEEAGLQWYYSLFASLTIYTGAFQFVLITFLSSGTSLLTIAITAFLMNSRQTFYSLTFVEEFRDMGKRLPYMIHTMTDETYAVNCSLEPDEEGRKDIMFWVALFSRCYWMIGAVAGGILGQLIPFELEGIDFCMTALFIIIFIDQWEKNKNHVPAILGLAISVVCLIIFGEKNFMLPALLIVSGLLLLTKENEVETR